MVLKEFFCSECSRFSDGFVDVEAREANYFCKTCKQETLHIVRCSGGIHSRWRMNDWDGYNPRGCIETIDTKVTTLDGNQVDPKHIDLSHKQEGTVNNWHKKHAPEREDKFRFEWDHKRGRTPLWFDNKPKA